MATKTTATKKVELVEIKPIEETVVTVRVVGDTPLITHAWDAKAKREILEKEMGLTKTKKRDPKNPKVVLVVDVIGPEGAGEIIGGSEREADYDALLARIKEQGLDPEGYSWYLDLRKYGSVPHAGFGMGIERMVRWVCGLQHVRETIPFARMMDKIHP